MSGTLLKIGVFSVVTIASARQILHEFIKYQHKVNIEDFLETRFKSSFKNFIRAIYNGEQFVKEIFYRAYNSITNNYYKVAYGGEIDYMLLYPIKAVSLGLKVESWETAVYGLKHDRQYMFAEYKEKTKRYSPVTIGSHTRFALVKVEYFQERNAFKFTYPTKGDLGYDFFELPANISEEFLDKHKKRDVDISVWLTNTDGGILEDLVPKSFYESMELDPEIVLLCSRGKPCTIGAPKSIKKTTIFQDYYPMLLCSTESVEEVKERFKEKAGYVSVSSFRPNIVVKGCRKPYDEDLWDVFDIISQGEENIRHRCVTPMKCLRCTIPNIMLDQGKMDPKSNATKLLSTYRRVDEGEPYKACWGMYVVPYDDTFKIKKGDKIDVIKRRSKYVVENPFA